MLLRRHMPLAMGAVNRLLPSATGIVLFAKDDVTRRELATCQAYGVASRTYTGIHIGIPNEAEGTIRTNIAEVLPQHRKSRGVFFVAPYEESIGVPASSNYRVVARSTRADLSVIEWTVG